MQVSRTELGEEEGRRYVEILTFTTNLEHIGDIIDKNLMELAGKKIKNRLTFSAEGMAELKAFHARVLENLRLSLNVFTTRDMALARRLVAEKTAMREVETKAADSHFARLREGRPESMETSTIHIDVIRDLKRINGHLTSVAYPILEAAGELADTRLKEAQPLMRAPAGVVGRLKPDLDGEPHARQIDLELARLEPRRIDCLAVVARHVAEADRRADRVAVGGRGEIADCLPVAQQRLVALRRRLAGPWQHDRHHPARGGLALASTSACRPMKPPGLSSLIAQPSPACHVSQADRGAERVAVAGRGEGRRPACRRAAASRRPTAAARHPPARRRPAGAPAAWPWPRPAPAGR